MLVTVIVAAVQDPHGELTMQNVLIERGSIADTAAEFSLTVDEVMTLLHNARQQLCQRRQLRPRPHLDNKMITAWNGLLSSSCCLHSWFNAFIHCNVLELSFQASFCGNFLITAITCECLQANSRQ